MAALDHQNLTIQKDFSTLEWTGQNHVHTQEIPAVKGSDPATIVLVAELLSASSSPSDTPIVSPRCSPSKIIFDNTIDLRETFRSSQSQWIDDPVISSWRNPKHRIYDVLADANELLKTWTSGSQRRPLSPLSDPLWSETGRTIGDVGLPWHNNQVGMPDDLDSSWPFHFKSYERYAMRAKGSRVGDPNPSGYICHPSEANCYCIRALQWELRNQCPKSQPLLVYDNFDAGILYSAQIFFGLQLHRISLSDSIENIVRELGKATDGSRRPVIFAACLATAEGRYDDLNKICEISKQIPMLLHLDMTRNFDYITNLPGNDRKIFGPGKLILKEKHLDRPLRQPDGSITVCTIVAGGAHYSDPPLALALKPISLGGTDFVHVSYVRGRDQSLAGSRDAIGPLWFSLQEVRFGAEGLQQVYHRCMEMKKRLIYSLNLCGACFTTNPYSLDLILENCSEVQTDRLLFMGAVSTDRGVLITVQPSTTSEDLNRVIDIMSDSQNTVRIDGIDSAYADFSPLYQIPQSVIDELTSTVESWKILTKFSAGYPLYMGSQTALGPVIGQFLGVDIPKDWLSAQKEALLVSRMRSFGLLTPQERMNFKAMFTNGSTMGNRVGLHAAYTRLPNATIYFSEETHYSVSKTMRDCDTLTSRWSGKGLKYCQIPCNEDGSISVDLLVQQALVDKREDLDNREDYNLILLINVGTTFVGARDNLRDIYNKLRAAGVEIAHIHADGAFDFGYSNCGIRLGPPGAVSTAGVPMVQGITLSNHKALGSIVSGEVISYSPGNELTSLEWAIDPRIIFERWLYSQAYRQTECDELLRYCRDNASRLEKALNRIGVATKRNPESMIVVLERPPAWITEEFSLRPEGDWVHFITVPDISPEIIDLFVDRMRGFKDNCLAAFRYVNPSINAIMGRVINVRRLQTQDPLAKQVVELAKSAMLLTGGDMKDLVPTVEPSMRSALSILMLDSSEQELEAVLLIESFRDQTMRVGALLIKSHHSKDANSIVTMAKLLSGYMARYVGAGLIIDQSSYNCIFF